MSGIFSPAEIESGDLVHVATNASGTPGNGDGGAFCVVVVRQLTDTEVTLFVGDTTPPVGDTWFWVYEGVNPVWEQPPAGSLPPFNPIAASAVIGLIKSQGNADARAAIAALMPVRTSA